MPYSRYLVFVLAVAALVTATPALAQSIFDGTASEQVEEATDLESVKTDLALCAPHLAQLEGHPDTRAFADSVQNPQCRKAVLEAEAAGLSKAEIVDILMGASDVPDPTAPTLPHGGPALVE